MAEPEVWYLRGEGGAVNAMTPPFGEGIAARLRAGALLRVNADGSPYAKPVEPEAVVVDDGNQAVAVVVDGNTSEAAATLAEQRAQKELAELATTLAPLPVPDRNARKSEWVKHAASTGRITESAADDLSRAELIERFGG